MHYQERGRGKIWSLFILIRIAVVLHALAQSLPSPVNITFATRTATVPYWSILYLYICVFSVSHGFGFEFSFQYVEILVQPGPPAWTTCRYSVFCALKHSPKCLNGWSWHLCLEEECPHFVHQQKLPACGTNKWVVSLSAARRAPFSVCKYYVCNCMYNE